MFNHGGQNICDFCIMSRALYVYRRTCCNLFDFIYVNCDEPDLYLATFFVFVSFYIPFVNFNRIMTASVLYVIYLLNLVSTKKKLIILFFYITLRMVYVS